MKQVFQHYKLNRQLNADLAAKFQYSADTLPLGLTTVMLFCIFLLEQSFQGAFSVTTLQGFVINVGVDLTMIVFIWLYIRKLRLEPSANQAERKRRLTSAVVVFCIMVVATLIVISLETVLVRHGIKASTNQQMLTAAFKKSAYGSCYIVLSCVLFAPIIEEFTFRYLIIKPCKLRLLCNRRIRGIISVVAFASLHVIGSPNWYLVIWSYLIISIGLTWIYVKYGSFWTNVGLHSAWNLYNLLLMII